MRTKLSVGIIGAGPGARERWMFAQWPRSAGAFWGMTRRFKAAGFSFEPVPVGTR